jgi:hypothetical protein
VSVRFRSLEDWRTALLTLPEGAYFDLMRSIFGNIKTPFNKQRLMDDLAALFSREETRKILGAYIDERDHRVIAAVALLEEPAPGDLESFFAGEFSCAELHGLLLNLEERFILYRFREEGVYRLALNPALEPVLAPLAEDTAVLFPSLPLEGGTEAAGAGGEAAPSNNAAPIKPPAGGPVGRAAGAGGEAVPPNNTATIKTPAGGPAGEPAGGRVSGGEAVPSNSTAPIKTPVRGFGDRNLAAFLAFVLEEPEFFRAGSGIRKRVLEGGRAFFPGGLLPFLAGAFLSLGLFRREGEEMRPVESKFRAFAALSPRERLEYCAAGLYLYLDEGDAAPVPPGGPEGAACGGAFGDGGAGGPFLYRSRIKGLAALVRRFLDCLAPDRRYPPQTLKRFADILEREGSPGGAAALSGWKRIVFDRFVKALEETGLLAPAGAGSWRALPGAAAGPGPGPVLAMDTPLSCILYPEIAFADALRLAWFCALRETGAAVRFELTRSSVVRGFDRGLDAAAITGLLSRLSGGRIDANLGWTLKDWEGRYTSVCLCRGFVLTLAEDRRYLAAAEPLASLVRATLAPGVYLLGVSESAGALEALKKAGVDIVAQRDGTVPGGGSEEAGLSGFPSLTPPPSRPPAGPPAGVLMGAAWLGGAAALPASGVPGPATVTPGSGMPEGEALKERFRAALDRLKVPRQERDELAARIERRLILHESQLAGAVIRGEKLEARGLDYVGKAAIAKQAIALKSLVEVSWTQPGGETSQALGIVAALEKKEGESVLVLNPVPGEERPREERPGAAPANGPEERGEAPRRSKELRLPLGKISLLRRIKQSIFEE